MLKITRQLWVLFALLVFGSVAFAELDKAIFKILVQNVGGSDFHLFDYKFGPNCPSYKLCHKEIIDRVRIHVAEHAPDVVLFQEIQNREQLLVGTSEILPILPQGYQAECARGAEGFYEVCIGWNDSVFELNEGCTALETGQSGALKCTLKNLQNGKDVDFINVHPNAMFASDRKALLKDVWTKLVAVSANTIVAGDFNSYETYPINPKVPHPPAFGAVFGRVEKKYGRWPATETFYGYRKILPNGRIQNREVLGSTIILRKLDNLFANFGELAGDSVSMSLPCGNNVCIGNVDGYDWGFAAWMRPPLFGPKTDHFPILANILF